MPPTDRPTATLQVMAKSVKLLQHKVHILLRDGSRRNNRTEEVGAPVIGLVAHHHRSALHHAGLDDRADLRGVCRE